MTSQGTYQQDIGNGYYIMVSPMTTGKSWLDTPRHFNVWSLGSENLSYSQSVVMRKVYLWRDHQLRVPLASGTYGVMLISMLSGLAKRQG